MASVGPKREERRVAFLDFPRFRKAESQKEFPAFPLTSRQVYLLIRTESVRIVKLGQRQHRRQVVGHVDHGD